MCRKCRRKTGKRPKTSMLKSVRENTCVVEGRREASTVEAIRAALVERDAGNLGEEAGKHRPWSVLSRWGSVDAYFTPTPPP